jgi:serine/threonine protein kinase
VRLLKILHASGYVYNSMRLSNILINYDENNQISVSLKNYKNCSKLFEMNGSLTKFKKGIIPTFEGDLAFSSLNQQEMNSTSRRDDIISLTYLLVFILNNCKMPFSKEYGVVSVE